MIGTGTLALAIWIKVDKNYLLDLTKDVSGSDLGETDIPSLLDNAVILLLAAGAFIFFIGFLGCCGTVNNDTAAGKLFLKIVSLTPTVHAQVKNILMIAITTVKL